MGSIFFALTCFAVIYAIFWSVRNDGVPPAEITGPFAMRRADKERKRARRVR